MGRRLLIEPQPEDNTALPLQGDLGYGEPQLGR